MLVCRCLQLARGGCSLHGAMTPALEVEADGRRAWSARLPKSIGANALILPRHKTTGIMAG
jgi:hypothetical protein